MAQVTEFDFPAAIKGLAEAEWKCPYKAISETDPHRYEHVRCSACAGTDRIVPFAALRVECPETVHSTKYECKTCHARRPDIRWVPEPDEEKAFARMLIILAKKKYVLTCWLTELGERVWECAPVSPNGKLLLAAGFFDAKQAVFCTAQAWLKEQHDLPSL